MPRTTGRRYLCLICENVLRHDAVTLIPWRGRHHFAGSRIAERQPEGGRLGGRPSVGQNANSLFPACQPDHSRAVGLAANVRACTREGFRARERMKMPVVRGCMKLSWLPWRRKVSLREAEDRRPSPGERQVAQSRRRRSRVLPRSPQTIVRSEDQPLRRHGPRRRLPGSSRALGEAMSARRRFEADLVPESARPPSPCPVTASPVAIGESSPSDSRYRRPARRPTLPNWREHSSAAAAA